MNTLAIICEYNPFHTGHAYHISEAKKVCGADTALGIMSGFFVQRAEPAIIEPSIRAAAALNCGLDAIIELPAVFSCASGNIFAEGAIKILSRIKSVKYLGMGVEDDGEKIKLIAAIQSEESAIFTDTLKNRLNDGAPYAAAITEATSAAAGDSLTVKECESILKKPNNVLSVEYIKAIIKYGADITPVFVKRKGNGYNDDSTAGEYISATAARSLMDSGRYDELIPYIPHCELDELINEHRNHAINYSVYGALTVHALRQNDISQSFDCAEGLDKKLYECAIKYSSLNDILQHAKSKRYTMSRIKRVCLQTLLGITENAMSCSSDAAARLIAIKKARKDILKDLTGVAVKNTDYAAFGDNASLIAKTDGTAGSVYALLTEKNGNLFWNRKLITL